MTKPLSVVEQAIIAALLERHYGDGQVYLQSSEDRNWLKRARALGLVSADGYITPAGHDFLATRRYEPPADDAMDERRGDYELLDDLGG